MSSRFFFGSLTYTRSDFTDALHDAFGFRTDYEIVSTQNMEKTLSAINCEKSTHFFKIKEILQATVFNGLQEFCIR